MPPRSTKPSGLEVKVDLLREDVTELKGDMKTVNSILATQEENLRLHMEGVRLAREQNTILKTDVDNRFSKVDEIIKPINDHVVQMRFLGKIVLAFVAFPAAIYYIAQIVRMLMGKI